MDKTAHQWFQDAARCYVEAHQGCAWCGGSHRVFHSEQGAEIQYYCMHCDFRTGYDRISDSYFSIPGENVEATATSKTMYQL